MDASDLAEHVQLVRSQGHAGWGYRSQAFCGTPLCGDDHSEGGVHHDEDPGIQMDQSLCRDSTPSGLLSREGRLVRGGSEALLCSLFSESVIRSDLAPSGAVLPSIIDGDCF